MKNPVLKLSGLAMLVMALFLSQRGRADAPASQFMVDGDIVTDRQTRLTWQRALGMTEVSFDDATQYCARLTLSGSDTWRVPGIKELQTLVDDETVGEPTAHEQAAFHRVGSDLRVWSATPVAGRPGESWEVNFAAGLPQQSPTNELKAVRCVR